MLNVTVDDHCALIVRLVDAAAVSVAVCFANRNGMPIAVLGGGYDWAGRSVRSGAMVIDLINMAFVDIDAERQIARVVAARRAMRSWRVPENVDSQPLPARSAMSASPASP